MKYNKDSNYIILTENQDDYDKLKKDIDTFSDTHYILKYIETWSPSSKKFWFTAILEKNDRRKDCCNNLNPKWVE